MIDIQKDLFGRHQVHRRTAAKSTEIFDLSMDLSDGERKMVAAFLEQKADELPAGYMYSKDRERIKTEAFRYERCAREAIGFYCPDCRTEYFVRTFCKSRICERCGRIYAKKLSRNIEPVLKAVNCNRRRGYVLSLITLTVTSKRFGDDLPDRDQLKRLYQETSDFFRLYYGKYHGKRTKTGKIREDRKRFIGAGWMAVLEVGKDNNNAHCHAIVYGPLRPWTKLRDSWQQITGDSRGVDIRPIRSHHQVVNYVLKYITKPPQTESYAKIADYAVMIKGTRRLRTGGIFYNRFTIPKPERRPCECIYCWTLLRRDFHLDIDHARATRIDLRAEQRAPTNPDPLKFALAQYDGEALPGGLPN